VLAVVVVGLCVAGWRFAVMNRSLLARQNCLLIVLDSLHADHLGCYGEPKPTSPTIDALAARGVLFERAWSQTSWTLPSTASLMTGLYQDSHGVVESKYMLGEEFRTMAEAFADAGYECLAFSQNNFASPVFGLGQGFETFASLSTEPDDRGYDDGRMLEEIRKALSVRSSRPRFIYAHFRRPHAPYDPPQEWRDQFVDAQYEGSVTGSQSDIEMHTDGVRLLGTEDMLHLRDLYQAGIRTVDEEVGQLLAGIEPERTLIILLSDHGEAFGQHGIAGHSLNSYEELVHIPFIMAHPALISGSTVDVPVMSIDVLPTVAELMGLNVDADLLQGRSLMPELLGLQGEPREAVFTASHIDDPGHMFGVSDGRWKYICIPSKDRRMLFDLESDPGETVDLASSHPEHIERLERCFEEWERRQVEPALHLRPELDPVDVKALKALGYFGDVDEQGRESRAQEHSSSK